MRLHTRIEKINLNLVGLLVNDKRHEYNKNYCIEIIHKIFDENECVAYT